MNAAGEREEFAREKVLRTCLRAGAERESAERIADEITGRVRDGMTTKHILKMTLKLLQKIEAPHVVARYDLKGAIMRLGPAGFPFETYFSEVLSEYGYATKLRQIIEGFCVSHEIDIIAEKKDDGERSMIECKYRNSAGDYVSVKEALYTYARFLDLVEGSANAKCPKFDSVWLVTNTKFSSDAIKYGSCRGMRLIGWGYPKGGSLQEMVEAKRLYPITVLRTLDAASQRRFTAANLMLCKHAAELSPEELSEKTGLSRRRLAPIIEEIRQVCEDG